MTDGGDPDAEDSENDSDLHALDDGDGYGSEVERIRTLEDGDGYGSEVERIRTLDDALAHSAARRRGPASRRAGFGDDEGQADVELVARSRRRRLVGFASIGAALLALVAVGVVLRQLDERDAVDSGSTDPGEVAAVLDADDVIGLDLVPSRPDAGADDVTTPSPVVELADGLRLSASPRLGAVVVTAVGLDQLDPAGVLQLSSVSDIVTPIGWFRPDATGSVAVRFDDQDASNLIADPGDALFVVTLEPSGGDAEPTPPVLASS